MGVVYQPVHGGAGQVRRGQEITVTGSVVMSAL